MKSKPNGAEPVYCYFVDHPMHGWIPIGQNYYDRKTAASWRSFVKSAWHGLPLKLTQVATLLGDRLSTDRPSVVCGAAPLTGTPDGRGH